MSEPSAMNANEYITVMRALCTITQ